MTEEQQIERLVLEWKRQSEIKPDPTYSPKVVHGENSFGKYTEVSGYGITVRYYHRNKHSVWRNVA